MKLKLFFKKEEKGEEHINAEFVAIGRILPNQAYMRSDAADEGIIKLANSIMRYGVLQPLTVRALENTDKKIKGKSEVYELISGQRRLSAARLAGLTHVPCRIIEADDRLAAELTAAENLNREELTYFEDAAAMASLIDTYGLSSEECAGVYGTTRTGIASKLRLLKLSKHERLLISSSGLSERHARAFLKICDSGKRLEMIREVMRGYLSAEKTEELVDSIICPKDEKAQRRKVGIKDGRQILNTLDKAVESIEKSGISVEKERRESDDFYEVVFKIKKPRSASQKTAEILSSPAV